MTTLSVTRMARRLTPPFARGADQLPLAFAPGASAATGQLQPYDFAEHVARFDSLPAPRYVIAVLRDVVDPVQLGVDYEVLQPLGPPVPGTATLDVPAGTLAGMSFALSLGDDEGPRTRLRTVRMTPPAPASSGTVADHLAVTALLGNLAKLLWVVGWEKDALRAYLAQLKSRRRLVAAVGRTLDLLGFDLGVPRFPPLPYSFEDGTVALYHLEDVPPAGESEVAQVEDAMRRFAAISHPGVNVGRLASSRAAGRFGNGFAFRHPSAVIEVGNHSQFAIGVASSFTAECFAKPDERAADGHVLAKHADPAGGTTPGWALSIGEFQRGIPRNARFLVSDQSQRVVLFADEALTTSRFHHLAGVIDRQAQEARLYLDGVLRSRQPIAGFAACTNLEPVRIGRTGGQPFAGVVDEVRLSRAALSAFHPVVGEADDSYRRRLRIFERWTLPTPAGIQQALNEVVGTINGHPDPFVVDDTDATLVGSTRPLTVVPAKLGPDETVDALGRRHTPETDASGSPADEAGFDPVFLVSHDDPARVAYGPAPTRTLAPGEAPPDPHTMQVATARALGRLLDLLQALNVAPRLRVEGAFDARAGDLRAVGRALLLGHENLSLERLGALAHRAGFSWVNHQRVAGVVYASVAPAEALEITVAPPGPTPPAGFDLLPGSTLLQLRPDLPVDVAIRWSIVACGAATAAFRGPVDQETVMLEVASPGELAIQVEVVRNRRAFTGSRRFRVALQELADGQAIADDGTLDAAETVAGTTADAVFDPVYLVAVDHPRVSFGPRADDRRMQPALARRLELLVGLMADAGATGNLRVTGAWVRGASGLEGVGRALALDPSSSGLPPGRLGALAHAAGFSWVRRSGTRIRVLHRAEDLAVVTGPTQLEEGTRAPLELAPRATPSGAVAHDGKLYVANAGTDTVTEIAVDTGTVTRVFKVGRRPAAVAVGGGRLCSADAGSDTVTVVDLGSGAVATVPVGGTPRALAHHPTAGRLYVTLSPNGVLAEVDTAASPPTVLGATPTLGNHPVAVALEAGGNRAWVVLDDDREVQVVNTGSLGAAPAVVSLPQQPRDIATDGSRAWVTMPDAGQLAIVDLSGNPPATVAVGGRPTNVALAPDSQTVYVTDPVEGRLSVRRPDGTARGAVGVGRAPVEVVASADRVYVVNRAVEGDPATTDVVAVVGAPALDLVQVEPLGSGRGERLTWVLRPGATAEAHLDSTSAPDVTVSGDRAGPVLVRAVYTWPDQTPPYSFEVRFNPALQAEEQAGTAIVIRKDQYDLAMNVLNALHPVGVEVSTRVIRDHVAELAGSLLDIFPAYTYPEFRVRGPRPSSRATAQPRD